jgi:hypothetical protein
MELLALDSELADDSVLPSVLPEEELELLAEMEAGGGPSDDPGGGAEDPGGGADDPGACDDAALPVLALDDDDLERQQWQTIGRSFQQGR